MMSDMDLSMRHRLLEWMEAFQDTDMICRSCGAQGGSWEFVFVELNEWSRTANPYVARCACGGFLTFEQAITHDQVRRQVDALRHLDRYFD